jgi:hypothetical protein
MSFGQLLLGSCELNGHSIIATGMLKLASTICDVESCSRQLYSAAMLLCTTYWPEVQAPELSRRDHRATWCAMCSTVFAAAFSHADLSMCILLFY